MSYLPAKKTLKIQDICHYAHPRMKFIFYTMLVELNRFSLFNDLSPSQLEIVAPLFHLRTYTTGAVIFDQGEKAICLYLLSVGKVELLYKPYDGQIMRLNTLNPGSPFGWSAVLGNPVYSSSAVCASDCEVLIICGDDLRGLRSKHPEIGNLIIQRLGESISQRRPSAQPQVHSMINNGISKTHAPLWKGEQKMTAPAVSPKQEQIKMLLEKLSAYIEQYHGGSVEFVDLDGDTLTVRLGGACLGCPLSPATLHGWVEGTIKQFFPEIKHVQPA